ncbi:flagellar basal body-associated protein FliL [Poseidonocella sedimentorum]|uniref:Flagellar protein FliL n=1 Tax=Poseidonocella sedimentorum TaxID=871652 RepID=A0A1I6D5Q4_9RHOB|nr:flagellar basal body-associated protein FliL [Poseidonocella sedimentorum]SFR00691.1 hypothetical protein SAMN04515673_102203 [Poseidonocella sedimentorum]
MIKKILPLVLALIGIAAGVGAGIALRPAEKAVAENPCGDEYGAEHAAAEDDAAGDHEEKDTEKDADVEYVEMSNQFVVPLVEGSEVNAMVVLSLSIEVPYGYAADVRKREPKLRDGFLRIMFDHANYGGFAGNFTSDEQLAPLRSMLTKEAKRSLPGVANDVQILAFMRQDL